MTELSVPRPRWPEFCAGFSREHHGWRVTLLRAPAPEMEADPAAALAAAERLASEGPLQALECSEHDHRFDITVQVGDGEGQVVRLQDVVALRDERQGRAHQGLRIDTADGASVLVAFRVAAPPEALDGLAETEL